MKALWHVLARVGTPAALFIGRSIMATWYALADVVRPVRAPLDALFAPWARRGVAQDLALADQLDAAGLPESATLLRDSAVKRLARSR